jgi:CrcB protein
MSNWISFLWVGMGGMLGAILRFGFSNIFKHNHPWLATGFINIIGSFFIGWVMAWTSQESANAQTWRWFLATGVCGGFTTFSTFSFENIQLLQSGKWGLALIYILSSVVLSLVAVWLGMKMGR